MGYRKAEEILPKNIIELIQQYVDGESIYIPRKAEYRQAWGSSTSIRKELDRRNQEIMQEHNDGISVQNLAQKYYLSEKSIQRILREQKK